jgi:tetratricopeptide (TPR) repeat protein
MQTLLYRALILLTVFGLIFTPPVLTGYAELQNAVLAWESGDFSISAASYRRALRFLPWRKDLWEDAATSTFFAGGFETSIPLFEKAVQRDSLSANGWDLYGQAYWWGDDHQSAREVWETGVDAYPDHAQLYAHLSTVYFGQGDLLAEREALENWITLGSEPDATAHYRLAILLSVTDPDRALGEFILTSSLDAQYDPVVETMRTAFTLASLETNKSRQLILIGRGLGLVNEWELAADAFRQAVDADGENAEAWAWLGEAEQQLGRDGRAELDKALSLGRENPIVRSLRGLYWMRQGRDEQALAEYLLAAEYDLENPAWHISIGEAYALRGDLQAALSAYLRATEIAPKDATVWRLLAAFCAQYNIQVEDVGLSAAYMAIELTGEDPLALDVMGWSLTLLERYDEAQDVLEHALSLDPQLAQAHLHYGIVAMQVEDWGTAREHLQQARDLDMDGPVGEQAQVLLNQYFP